MLFVNAQWTKSNWYPLNKKISPHHVEQAPDIHNIKCHAPRERVSWNAVLVTLDNEVIESRSTWACELKLSLVYNPIENYCHAPRERVSWNFALRARCQIEEMSRSTWACELKLDKYGNLISDTSHAPRERVSWNSAHWSNRNHWKVTLHVSVWVEMFLFPWYKDNVRGSRSTWACELKLTSISTIQMWISSRSTWACELKS